MSGLDLSVFAGSGSLTSMIKQRLLLGCSWPDKNIRIRMTDSLFLPVETISFAHLLFEFAAVFDGFSHPVQRQRNIVVRFA